MRQLCCIQARPHRQPTALLLPRQSLLLLRKAPAIKKDLTFGYIAYDMSDIWNEYSAKAFEYAAEQNGVKTVVLDSKNSLEDSVTAMESLIQQGVDGISVFPISTEQGSQLVKMANEAGIPVTIENFAMDGLDDPGDYIASVACEYDKIGEAAHQVDR